MFVFLLPRGGNHNDITQENPDASADSWVDLRPPELDVFLIS